MTQAARELLPILLVFYLLDGLTLVGPSHFLLIDRTGLGFRLGSERWGSGRPGSDVRLRLVGLLPWEIALASHRPLIGLTPAGIHWLHRPDAVGAARLSPESWRFLAWEDLAAVSRDDRKLSLRPRAEPLPAGAISFPTSSIARSWCERIAALLERPAESRAEEVAAADSAASDLHALSAQHLRQRPALERLGSCGSLLALGLFVAVPTAMLVSPPSLARQVLLALLAGCLALQGLGAYFIVRLARTLRRDGAAIPTSLLLSLCLYPPATIHATSSLSRHLHARFDGLALVATFLEPEELSVSARSELWSAHHALGDETLKDARAEEPARESWIEMWQGRIRLVYRILEQHGLHETAVSTPPPREDPAATAFCGLCGIESLDATRVCPDCGVPLSPFEGAARPVEPFRER